MIEFICENYKLLQGLCLGSYVLLAFIGLFSCKEVREVIRILFSILIVGLLAIQVIAVAYGGILDFKAILLLLILVCFHLILSIEIVDNRQKNEKLIQENTELKKRIQELEGNHEKEIMLKQHIMELMEIDGLFAKSCG